MNIVINDWWQWKRDHTLLDGHEFRHRGHGKRIDSCFMVEGDLIWIYSENGDYAIRRTIPDTFPIILAAEEFVEAWYEAKRRAREGNSPANGELQSEPLEDGVSSM